MSDFIWDETSELSTIGAILLDGKCFDRVSSMLDSTDFHDHNLSIAFKSMRLLANDREDIDFGSVITKTKSSNKSFNSINFMERLSQASYSAVTAANVEYHAKAVKAYSVRRSLLNKSRELQALARDTSKQIDDVISATSQMITDLSSSYHSSTEKPKKIVDVAMNIIDSVSNNEPVRKVSAGFAGIEFPVGLVSCIAGRPSNGKSIIGLNAAANAAAAGKHVLYYTIEDNAENMVRRILSRHANLSTKQIERADVDMAEMERLRKQITAIAGHNFWFIGDERDTIDVGWIRDYSYTHQSKHGQIDIIVVDYLQLLDFDAKENEVQALNKAMKTLKAVAKRLNCAVVIMSQVIKDSSGVQCPDPPTIGQLKGSGMIFEISKYVLTVHYPFYYTSDPDDANMVRIACLKNSNGITEHWFSHCNYSRMTVGDRVDDVPAPSSGWQTSEYNGDY
jgi:replicative DNA helicase